MTKKTNSNTKATIDELFEILREDYTKPTKYKLPLEERATLIKHINSLLYVYVNEDIRDCIAICIKSFIPLLELNLVEPYEKNTLVELYDIYRKSFALAGRRSLEHFIMYYEWNWRQEDKLYENRHQVLKPFIFYLNKSAFDPNLKIVIASYMPSSGKCIKSDTPVFTPKGHIAIKDLNIGEKIYSMKDNKLTTQKVLNKWISHKSTINITTKSNRNIVVSKDHRLLTFDGYKMASQITKDDYLFSLLTVVDGKEVINDDELVFISGMIFEGHCVSGKLSYTGEENEMTIKFLNACDNLGITYKKYKKTGTKAFSLGIHQHKAKELLEEYGILNHLCYTKRLPQKFYNLSLKQKYDFISIMFATDGYICGGKNTNDFGITLANEELVKDIQFLLNTCGIYSSIGKKTSKQYKSWRLYIPKEYILKLKDKCYFYHKQSNFDGIYINEIQKRGNMSVTYPKEIFESLKSRKNLRTELHMNRDTNRSSVTFESFVKSYPEIEKYRYKDFYWETIKNIEYSDEEVEMIDIEVSETNNFIANGYVSHNSRCMSYYEAWRLGVDKTGAILRISYDDSLVKGFSRSVIDIIKAPEYSDVFPELNYAKNKKMFLKETDEEWKLYTARLNYSYIAKTRYGGITGARASLSIDIDDIVKDDVEATNQQIHEDFWNKWNTVIRNRKSGKNVKYIVVGTKWSPEDFICRLGDNERKRKEFIDDPLFKFVEKSTDGSCVIISVPALDPDTDMSTCEAIETTQDLRELRDDTNEYFWQCVYQQDPIPPEGIDFAKENLTYYDTIPLDEKGQNLFDQEECVAVLDPARKGKNYVSMPILRKNIETNRYYLIDLLYKKKSMKELYDNIVAKIIEHNINKFTIENNTDTSLAYVIEEKLKALGYFHCNIEERYATTNKEDRIKNYASDIKSVVYKDKSCYSSSSDYGIFMRHLTSYSFNYANKYDDAPDSIALFGYKYGSGVKRKNIIKNNTRIIKL